MGDIQNFGQVRCSWWGGAVYTLDLQPLLPALVFLDLESMLETSSSHTLAVWDKLAARHGFFSTNVNLKTFKVGFFVSFLVVLFTESFVLDNATFSQSWVLRPNSIWYLPSSWSCHYCFQWRYYHYFLILNIFRRLQLCVTVFWAVLAFINYNILELSVSMRSWKTPLSNPLFCLTSPR